MNWLIELFCGPSKCLTGNCTNPVLNSSNHCASCHEHMESIRQGSGEDRERAYVKANIREWQKLIRKYPELAQ